MIAVHQLHKSFGNEKVLEGLNFEIQPTKTLCIMGPSGCGKSTLLKVLAGQEQPDQGRFEVEGEDLFALPPQQRGVVYMSQEPLLFPHLSVFENLAFGLRIRKIAPSVIRDRVIGLADGLGLSGHLDKNPQQLSGGQKQRVNFGRTLIINPKIMLLDEPFGSLDSDTRHDMQQLFKRISQAFGITALFVTHDLKEALTLGDHIGVMNNGALRVYPSVEAFIREAGQGVQEEIVFWNRFVQP